MKIYLHIVGYLLRILIYTADDTTLIIYNYKAIIRFTGEHAFN